MPGGGLDSARAELLTQYGSAVSGWTVRGGRLRVAVRVPPNAHGTVHLPGATLADVREGDRAVASVPGVTSASQARGETVVEIGSGDYSFEYPAPPMPAAPAQRAATR
jgi:alpha-L-rhamnosidase